MQWINTHARQVAAVLVTLAAAGASIATSVDPWGPSGPNLFAVFLVKDGNGSLDESRHYYKKLGVREFEYTITDFERDFMSDNELVTSVFYNAHELGFWRQMRCTELIGRGFGGCAVSNHDTAEAAVAAANNNQKWNRGTVAMRIDDEGHTLFYVFDGGGALSTTAVLDSEFNKAVPQVCTNCHGGGYDEAGGLSMGAVFREFDPSQLVELPEQDRADAEREWLALNQVVRMANDAVQTQAEGAPFGTDLARESVNHYIDELYITEQPISHRDVRDPYFVPESWLAVSGAEAQRKNEVLWTQVVMPYCMNCHRTSTFRHESFGSFQMLAGESGDEKLFQKYLKKQQVELTANGEILEPAVRVMPHSELQYKELMEDPSALGAIHAWLDDEPNVPPVVELKTPPHVFMAADWLLPLEILEVHDANDDYLVKDWTQTAGPPPGDFIFLPEYGDDAVVVAPEIVDERADMVFTLTVDDRRTGVVTRDVTVTLLPVKGVIELENNDVIPFEDVPSVYEIPFDVAQDATLVTMQVYVELSHPDGSRVDARLISPAGDVLELGTFDAPVTEHQRTFDVSQLIGASTQGTWRVRLDDNLAESGGEVRQVRLTFATAE